MAFFNFQKKERIKIMRITSTMYDIAYNQEITEFWSKDNRTHIQFGMVGMSITKYTSRSRQRESKWVEYWREYDCRTLNRLLEEQEYRQY